MEADVLVIPVATISQVGEDLIVKPERGALMEMKQLGATWDRNIVSWKLPAARMNLVAATEALNHEVVIESSVQCLGGADPAGVDDERLYPFQRIAVQRLADAPHGMLLCATPGLGKTAMAIVAADIAVPGDQVVVVSPKSLIRTWKREIVKWSTIEGSVAIVYGTGIDWEKVREARWLVTTWETVVQHQDWFKGRWPLWVLDETITMKSRRSQRRMAMAGGKRKAKVDLLGQLVAPEKRWDNLRKTIGTVWLLSGSPTSRHVDDLWSQLNLIWPRAFRSYWRFAERYCVIEETPWARNVIETRKDRNAMADNSDLVHVVAQSEVLELPEYLFEAVDVELAPKQRKAYDTMLNEFSAELDSVGDSVIADNRAAQLIRLQQIVSYWNGDSAKHEALYDMLRAGVYELPMLVWTHWTEGSAALAERLSKILTVELVTGDTPEKKRDEKIEAYKAGKVDVLILALGVGKYGHTLVNTRTVAYVDKTFSADDYFQSLRRVRRIGLEHSPVVTTLRAPGTTDDMIELNLEGKLGSISKITNSQLRELLLGLGR